MAVSAAAIPAPARETGLAETRSAKSSTAAGVWSLAGIAVADPDGWAAGGLDVRTGSALSVPELAQGLSAEELVLVDVRDRSDWGAGHVADSIHIALAELSDGRTARVPPGEPLAVACAGGGRAALAASVLRRRGHVHVARVAGGGVADLARHGVALVGARG